MLLSSLGRHKCSTNALPQGIGPEDPRKTIDRTVKIVYREREADNGQDGVTLVLFFPALFFVSLPFLTPKISRVSTSLCGGRLSFDSEKGNPWVVGGKNFPAPYICAVSAISGFRWVWVCVSCFVDSKRKSQQCFIGFYCCCRLCWCF